MICGRCGLDAPDNEERCPICHAELMKVQIDPKKLKEEERKKKLQQKEQERLDKLKLKEEERLEKEKQEKEKKLQKEKMKQQKRNPVKEVAARPEEVAQKPKNEQAENQVNNSPAAVTAAGEIVTPGAAAAKDAGKSSAKTNSGTLSTDDIMSTQKPIPQGQAKKFIFLGLIGVAAVGSVLNVLSTKLMKTAINLNEFLTVEIEGYDSIGEAYINFDDGAFQEKYGSKKHIDELYNLFTYNLSECENLSNGDIVTLYVEYDSEEASKLGFKLTGNNQDYTVETLLQAEIFDAFEGVDVFCSGISGDGIAEDLYCRRTIRICTVCRRHSGITII